MLKNIKFIAILLLFVSVANADEEVTDVATEEESSAAVIPKAEEKKSSLYMEINKLEQREDLCVAYVRFSNRSDTEFSEFKSELFAFNKEEIITAHFLADFQQVMANKTVVKLVPMKDTVCSEVGSILLNRMTACKSGDQEVPNCLRMLETGAKGTIKLFK